MTTSPRLKKTVSNDQAIKPPRHRPCSISMHAQEVKPSLASAMGNASSQRRAAGDVEPLDIDRSELWCVIMHDFGDAVRLARRRQHCVVVRTAAGAILL